MRATPLLILVPVLSLAACGKKDLETETEATPAPDPTAAQATVVPELPEPPTEHPFRVPDATLRLPSTNDTRSAVGVPGSSSGSVNESATVTARPPETPAPTGNTE